MRNREASIDQTSSKGADAGHVSSYTASDALLDGLEQMGVTHLFANFGSDHPEIIEALAKRRMQGRLNFHVVVCPHESVALAAAHGYAMVSGRPQAVFVHVDVGTQTMGGAVHNACRARAPVFIFAGETPYTIDGELFGSRNRPAQVLQDVPDQHGVLRAYVKWSMSVRTGRNIQQLVYRAMQLARSEPCGMVYLTGAREVMSELLEGSAPDRSAEWPSQTPSALPAALAAEIAQALASARKAVLITSYAGRRPEAVNALVQLAERAGVMVVEESPIHLNFPRDHDLHGGFQAAEVVTDADVILVVDCDVPWISATVQLPPDARIYHLDIDPLKARIPLWHIPVRATCLADSRLALEQLNEALTSIDVDASGVSRRVVQGQLRHRAWCAAALARVRHGADALSAEAVAAALSNLIDDDVIVIDETVTNVLPVLELLPRRRPGTYLSSGGSSLGFGGGAAIGAKLAAPDQTVVCVTGDGSYLFGVPSAVHMVARRQGTAFLTVILNNGGWNATKQNVLRLHPEGVAQRTDQFWVSLGQEADLAGIAAAAGGSLGLTVRRASELQSALEAGLNAVRQGRAAVVDVRLAPISMQAD